MLIACMRGENIVLLTQLIGKIWSMRSNSMQAFVRLQPGADLPSSLGLGHGVRRRSLPLSMPRRMKHVRSENGEARLDDRCG